MTDRQIEKPSGQYSGRGWDFVRFQNLPEGITAPLAIAGGAVLVVLFSVGVFLIYKLVERVWSGTDTVPAASAALTAIAAIFGAVFLTWRTVVAHWQARASQEQASVAKESHYTTLFTKAVEQLGATRDVKRKLIDPNDKPTEYEITETEPNLEVRLGAIYALERIARDSERDHCPITEVLCAYIRNPRNTGKAYEEKDKLVEKWPEQIPSARMDIQAAIAVIGRRSEERISFEESCGHYLDFSKANLQSANLYSTRFPGAQFSGARLENASMQRSNFSGSQFVKAQMRNANLSLSNLKNANFDLADLSNAAFYHASAVGASFGNARMWNVKFYESVLDRAYFFDLYLNSVSFRDVSLIGTNFRKCDLTGSSFEGAIFSVESVEADELTAKEQFNESTLFDCDFSGALGLSTEHLRNSFGDLSVRLPENLERPRSWANELLSDHARVDFRYSRKLPLESS